MIRDTSAQDRLVEVKPNRKRQLILLGAGALVLALLAWLAPGVGRLFSASASVSSSRLAFATVERGPFVRDIAAEGKVVAAVSPTLYATSGGAVTLKVHAGDTVKVGQVLATIVSPELTNKLAQEQSNADAMEVEYRRAQIDARKQRSALQETYDNAVIDQTTAERNLDRYQKAFAKGAVSNMDVDKAKDALDKAKIATTHARANLGLDNDSLNFDIQSKKLAHERQLLLVKDLQRQVDDLNVKSPVDGQVGQLFIAERATVAKDAQLLSVIDLSALQVEMQVPESFARDLGIGMAGEISGNGHTWKGLVSAISPEVVNGQVAARLRFEGDTPKQLRQNQRLSVRVLLDKRDNVLTVQRGSFVDESGGSYAYLVKDGIASKTPIRVGVSSIDKVEILDGLKEGDRIVISGTDSFKGAATVAISN
ncbi:MULTISPECIES: efflux RND transporter periplasmic adaptor subunit [Rhodanobacter]|uniref:RND family efflux transporter, MFP subunit n=1 Tax=Rhodanobacter denitrificans TaxID=666685 RepID=M4NBG2_9GAMM|nr:MULTISPECIES: efflux RND transporter periplasmic adaptor subunit [Rhodanobacter]AGG87970.1 RND family efflux transporter, MFP subunit [Rhodanobacter denitrificans]KZC21311.1 efflux transporter periplasmic adaptor subunit [Rhodanobacter denitrificans]UJJ51870.1 efflux RND transporter periplasmic adaptor subunit [Rhodanobacter denitrificans]UJM87124.1 efflux RND transporter periplasmic adaptor subunit [Rhodanobacter denitrificans]UJM94614.1 efflux RND transporter periplasmic adaptor subunit [